MVVGGNSLLNGFCDRLNIELSSKIPPVCWPVVVVVAVAAAAAALVVIVVKKVKKGKESGTCYSASYMSQTRDQKRFAISELAADWHELMIPQCTMRPSISSIAL